MPSSSLPLSDPEERRGRDRAVGGEVLAAHDRRHLDESLLAELGHDRPLHRGGGLAVVDDRVVADLVVEAVRRRGGRP